MTPIQAILVVIIRLWAAGVIVSMATNIPVYLFFVHTDDSGQNNILVTTALAPFVVWCVAGIAAWVAAPRLARLAYSASHEQGVTIDVDADMFVMIGSFLIGCFYLVSHAPQLIADLINVLAQLGQQDPNVSHEVGRMNINRFNFENFAKNTFIVVVAFWMAFRPQHLARVFSWLRGAGLSPRDFQTEQAPSEKGK